MNDTYLLYGWEHSLFSGKMPGYLRYKGIKFEERIATPEVFEKIIIPFVGSPIMPALETPSGELVQDTTDIIDFLETRYPEVSIYPTGPRQKLAAYLLELYGSDWLQIPAMHYRWSVLDQQRDFIAYEFGRAHDPEETRENQIKIGETLFEKYLPFTAFIGISEQTIPAIEATCAEFLTQLNAHFIQHPFLFGSRPSIGDYGLLAPLYAHLGRDPIPKALMQSLAPEVYKWVERMNHPEPLSGEFLPDDEVPETLIPILKTLCGEFMTHVMDTIRFNSDWLDQNPGTNVPRFHGFLPFTIGGVQEKRAMHSFNQWLFQRGWTHYHSLTGSECDAADQLLGRIAGLDALQTKLPYILRREPGQLELVEDTNAESDRTRRRTGARNYKGTPMTI